ncbi:MAG: hypothetical protein A2231_10475 [Candidatus Firestonebacteria bacterium RIFOXYA2_FULL_40_8]|nr:MAG: hypothetical protein A2231_10475 [Candidatus Firestonebacteria bacterium RIFOXYA2_FULL_40_8]
MRVWRPFSKDSPWNTVISKNPKIDKNSKKMVADLFLTNSYPDQPAGKIGVSTRRWSIPVYHVDEKKVKWSKIHYSLFHKYCHPQFLFNKAPIPASAKADKERDAHMTILNKSLTKCWDFWALTKFNGKWLARSGKEFSLTGKGVQKPGEGGCRAAGFPLIAGLIRYEEIKQGKIEHSLVFGYNTAKRGVYCYPACNSDGTSTRPGAIPEGARLQLDPSVDIESLNLKPAAKIIAKALQEYGMYLGDCSGGFAVYAEVFPGKKSKWEGVLDNFDLFNIPTKKLRVLKLPEMHTEGIPLDWPTDKMLKKDPGYFNHYN